LLQVIQIFFTLIFVTSYLLFTIVLGSTW